MNTWKDHNGIKLFHELPRPFLFVWNIAKDMVCYILDLIAMCWNALCSAMNKNVLIPAAAAAFGILFVNYGYDFVLAIMYANNHSGDPIMSETAESIITMVVQLLSILPLCWGMATIASVIKAKDEEKDDSWKQHIEVGQKAVRFFLNFIGIAAAILIGLVVFSFIGKIPQIGKPLLSLLIVPFYFASMVFWLTVVGLIVGAFFFGSFYLSGKYEESASLMSRAKALYCMAGSKIVDFLTAGLPAAGMALLFLIIPAYLTMASIQLMEWPSKDVWSGFRFPDVVQAFHNTNEYPASADTDGDEKIDGDEIKNAEANRLIMPGNMQEQDYPYVENAQFNFTYKAEEIDGNDPFTWLDEQYKEWSSEEENEDKNEEDYAELMSTMERDITLEYDDGWIVTEHTDQGDWTYSIDNGISFVDSYNENNKWASDNIDGSEVYFDGESHSRIMIWLTALILVFSSSVVIAVPAGFLLASIGATSYRLYVADFSAYAIWKRIAVLGVIVSAIGNIGMGMGGMGCLDCLDDVELWRFDINFGQNRQEIYREENNSYDYKEKYDYEERYDYDDYDDWDNGDDGW